MTDAHHHRARDDAVLARNAQAAFKARLLALSLDDLGVDELDDLALRVLHDADAAQDTHLRGGETHAAGLGQRVSHVVEQLMEAGVEFGHRAADFRQAGIAFFSNGTDSHSFHPLFSIVKHCSRQKCRDRGFLFLRRKPANIR